MGVFVIKSV